MYCLCVNVYCHRVSTQLQLTEYINQYQSISYFRCSFPKQHRISLAVKGRTQHNVTLPVECAQMPVARYPWRQNVLACPLIFVSPQYWLCFLLSFSGSKTLGLLLNFSKIRASLLPSSVEMSTSFCSSVPMSEERHVPFWWRPQPFIMSHFKLGLCLKRLTATPLKILVFWHITLRPTFN
jgi:hypothetical protein